MSPNLTNLPGDVLLVGMFYCKLDGTWTSRMECSSRGRFWLLTDWLLCEIMSVQILTAPSYLSQHDPNLSIKYENMILQHGLEILNCCHWCSTNAKTRFFSQLLMDSSMRSHIMCGSIHYSCLIACKI